MPTESPKMKAISEEIRNLSLKGDSIQLVRERLQKWEPKTEEAREALKLKVVGLTKDVEALIPQIERLKVAHEMATLEHLQSPEYSTRD